MANSFLSYKSFTLKAGKTVTHNVTGQIFVCKESSAAFSMKIDDEEAFAMEVGLGFRLEGKKDTFTRLNFINDTVADITISYYAGSAEVKDARLNTLLTRNIQVSLRVPPTTMHCLGETALGPGVTQVIPANTSRKQITVTNADATVAVKVVNSSNTIGAWIFPQQSWTVETTDQVGIINPDASATVTITATEYNYS